MFHITDWLPTLYNLAGGKNSLPTDLDGHDIWRSISEGVPSPREEIVLQIDPLGKEYALRWKQWKLHLGTAITLLGVNVNGT